MPAASAAPLPKPIPEVRSVQPQRPRWPLLVGGAIILLLGIGAAVVLLRRTPSTPASNTNSQNVNVAANTAAAPATTATSATALPQPITNDKDRDGLTDDEEATLGTNPAVADTDGDGLSDYDEVKVYETDPRKPDTDGDGSTDGIEVEKGYNPKGPGKLLNFEAAKQQLTK